MATLTLCTLRAKGACKDQVALFREMFGTQVEITVALCVEHADKFDFEWAACNLLKAEAWASYAAARAEAWAAYEAATAEAFVAYDAAKAEALTAYAAARAEAWAAYKAATAEAFAAAFIKQTGG